MIWMQRPDFSMIEVKDRPHNCRSRCFSWLRKTNLSKDRSMTWTYSRNFKDFLGGGFSFSIFLTRYFSNGLKFHHHPMDPFFLFRGDHLAFHRFGEGLGECLCHWRSHQCPARREVSVRLSSATATHPCTKSPAVRGYQPGRGTHRTPGEENCPGVSC